MNSEDLKTRRELAAEFSVSIQAIEQRLRRFGIFPVNHAAPFLYSRSSLLQAIKQSKGNQAKEKIAQFLQRSEDTNEIFNLVQYAYEIDIPLDHLRMIVRWSKVKTSEKDKKNNSLLFPKREFRAILIRYLVEMAKKKKVL